MIQTKENMVPLLAEMQCNLGLIMLGDHHQMFYPSYCDLTYAMIVRKQSASGLSATQSTHMFQKKTKKKTKTYLRDK